MTSASRFFALALAAGCSALVFASGTGQPAGVTPQASARYLEYARASADWAWDRREESLARWRAQFDPESPFGYRPPGGLLETALVYSYLYEKEGTPRYAERARDILLTYGDYRKAFPEWAAKKRPDYDHGVPALPDFFVVMRYLRAYDALHRLGRLSPPEVAAIEEMVGHSIDYLLQTSEWGTMNRTVLRAESLAWAVKALPNHPRAAVWEKQR